jgi:transposase
MGVDPTGLSHRLREMYVDQGLSTYAIAAELGIDRQRVNRMLRRAGVELADRGAGRARPSRRVVLPPASGAALADMYVRDQRTTDEIGAHFNISGSTVQRLLREQGIRVRTRGPQNREGRIVPNIDLIEKLYLGGGLSADEVGRELGCSRHIVLRVVHDLGWPVRIGGPAPRKGPTDIELVSALYADPLVAATLRRHGIQPVGAGGSISFRFPVPLVVSALALQDLYVGCGVSTRHLELLTGVPSMTVTQRLRQLGIVIRPTGGRSPFLQRWRAQNDRPSKGGPQRSTRSHSSAGDSLV